MTLLNFENISKSFGERKLFQNLSLILEVGKIYSLMGANGSGKTTLFNILTGFIKADSGKILFKDHDLNSSPPNRINNLGIARTFQDLRIINNLSVRENILLAVEKKMFHFPTDDEKFKTEKILKQVSLFECADNLGTDLSYGQQKLLTLGCCLANNPQLLLLDEPISGIDKENLEKIRKIVMELRNEGKSILQIEHNKDYIESTSDCILLLEDMSLKVLETAY